MIRDPFIYSVLEFAEKVPACSQSIQAVTGQEKLAGIKTAGT